MNKKIRVILFFLGTLGCSEVFAGWQPTPRIGVEMDPSVMAYFVAPRFEYVTAWQAFDANKHSVGLDQLIFGKTVQIQDIFLAARLAGQPGYTNANSGSYLSLISTCTMSMEAQQNYNAFSLEGSLTFALGNSDVLLTTGITVPIESFDQTIDVKYIGAELGSTFGGGAVTDPQYFFTFYPDVDGFVQTEILAPKGLTLKPFQRSQGLGAIRLYSMLDFSNYWPESFTRLQGGFVAHLNSTQQQNPDIVWPVERGLGATYLGGFGQMYLDFADFLKPFFVVEVTAAVASDLNMRVPVLKTVTGAQVAQPGGITLAAADILSSSNPVTPYSSAKVTEPFSYFDSSVPFFADQSLLVRRRRGTLYEVKFGNRFDLGGKALLDIWYEHAHRMGDKITRSKNASAGTEANVYNFNVVTQNTRNSYHIMGWQTIFNNFESVKLTLGSQYVVKGKIAPQYCTWFMQFEFGF